jgi:uncharacterized protein YraI
MKKAFVSIILGGLLLLTACFPMSLKQAADATATKMVADFFATQTGLAYPAYLQQQVDATTTAMAGNFYATQTKLAFQLPGNPISNATNTPISTSQSTSQAVVNVESLSIRSGPGTAYDIQSYAVIGDKLTILGQAYNCSWLKVKTTDGQTGWASSTYLVYHLACGEISLAPIPPVPTEVAEAKPTNNPSPSCDPTGTINITNDTGGVLSLSLSGPASYNFNLGTGSSTLNVCPGTYNYTVYACGGASKSGTMSTGESHTFYCGSS